MNHDGHRARIRKKFMNGDSLEDHEILEMVLFSSIPRCNTNEYAHELINRFGSLRGVFDADAASLQEVEGIGPSSAFLLRLISECIARYFLEIQDTRALLDHRTVLEEYLRALFIGYNYERALILFFNGSGRLLCTHELGKGSVNLVHLSTREVLTLATQANATHAILVHNHPDGVLFPSDKDLAATLRISEALKSIDVNLIDHFIVAGNKCRPILYYRDHEDEKEKR
jgi:DNA repair protein RadC